MGLLEVGTVFSLGNILTRISEQEEIRCEREGTMCGAQTPHHSERLLSPSGCPGVASRSVPLWGPVGGTAGLQPDWV